MCDPVTLLLVGAGLTAGGYGANMVAQDQVDSARKSAMSAESARQRSFADQLYPITERSQNRYANATAQGQTAANDIAAFYAATADAAAPTAVMPATDSTITNTEREKKGGEARRFNDQQGQAQANVRSFGDFLTGAGRGVQRDTGEAGTIANFMRGSQAVLPLELDDANRAGAGMKLFGDLLSGVGSLGMSAGLSGSFASPTATTTPGVRAPTTPAARTGGFGRLAGPV